MKKVNVTFVVFFFTIFLIESCSKSSSGNGSVTPGGGSGITFSCSGISPKFTQNVKPIFNTVCSITNNCHGSGSTNTGGPFVVYSQIFAQISNIRSAVLSGVMPQSGSLSQAQINDLICWIDSGAPNN